MIDRLSLGVVDVVRAVAFYNSVLAPVGRNARIGSARGMTADAATVVSNHHTVT